MPTILLLGGSGRLGTALRNDVSSVSFLAPSRQELDPTNEDALCAYIETHSPDLILNTIANNAVDQAESEPVKQDAFFLNTTLPELLAKTAKQFGIPFLHISTDYVFDGEKPSYTEEDTPDPINVYGQSKYQGEQAVLTTYPEGSWVIRTARLFGAPAESANAKKSFIDLILRDAGKSATVLVNREEYGLPTSVHDLVRYLETHFFTTRPAPGIYHATNSGTPVTWHEWARAIGEDLNLPTTFVERDPKELNRAAKRPARLELLSTKLPPMRDWRESQRDFFKQYPPNLSEICQP